MTQLSLNELQEILNAERFAAPGPGCAAVRLDRVRIDSREIRRGDIFWALRGERRHGAAFTEDAFGRGAVGVVVDVDDVMPAHGRTIRPASRRCRAIACPSGRLATRPVYRSRNCRYRQARKNNHQGNGRYRARQPLHRHGQPGKL